MAAITLVVDGTEEAVGGIKFGSVLLGISLSDSSSSSSSSSDDNAEEAVVAVASLTS